MSELSEAPPQAATSGRRNRSAGPGSTLLAAGEPLVWLTSGALVVALAMIVGLLALVFWLGSTTFLVSPLVQVDLVGGGSLLGEVFREERVPLSSELIFREPPIVHRHVIAQLLEPDGDVNWQALPDEVEARAAALTREQSAVQARLETARRELAAFEAARGPAPQSPAAKADWIRADGNAEARARAEQLVETLTSRQEALAYQVRITEQTAAQLRKQTSVKPLEAILALDEDAQTAVVDALLSLRARQVGQPEILVRRRLLRTGNFDLTQTHFTWVTDYQIKPDGETRPEWAMLVERQKDGNFYGLLDALVVRTPRPVEEDEKQLNRQILWLEQHGPLLKKPDQKELLAKALVELRRQRNRLYRERAVLFVATFFQSEAETDRLAAVTASGKQIPIQTFQPQSVPDDDPVVEVREAISEPAAAWNQFAPRHAEVVARLRARESREQRDAGRTHQLLEDARLACKEVELRVPDRQRAKAIPVLDLALQHAANDRALAESRQQVQSAKDTQQALLAKFGPGSSVAQAAALIVADVTTQEQARQARLATSATAAREQLAAEPDYAQDAVNNYLRAEAAATTEPANGTPPAAAPTYELRLKTAQNKLRALPLEEIVRAIPANRLSGWQNAKIYLGRWWEFLTAEPRNGNSEGGVFPAIFGTVVMTLLMSLAVVPFGVLAALYLREYAKAGPIVSIIRISINNLAGVPSIVFGVFGLGFFCYVVGAYIDGGPEQAQFRTLPRGPWLLLATLTAVICVAAFTAGLFGLVSRRAEETRRQRIARVTAGLLWVAATLLAVYLLATTPLFHGFYREYAPNPKFGTGGLLWASLTLALLTLPVVIVATEEALSAVPNSMREGSYACGASRWQTIRRVVLPQALPGIMTGMILAMARGAGEVAPLMLVGAVHTAPALPIDTTAPFVHPERSFMHLGYHIYYLGFQSQNSQAAMPMVFTTTLLLIAIVASLNLMAMWLRAKLRKRFQSGQF